MKRQGFSLVESLLSLTFFLAIFVAGLEFFGMTRSLFFKLKEAQEAQEDALAALDKMRTDARQAGQGLSIPIGLGIISGVEQNGTTLTLASLEKSCPLLEDLSPGLTTIRFQDEEGLAAGKEICIFDNIKGEVAVITSADKNTLTLAAPLANGYLKTESVCLLVEKVSLFLDAEKSVLRRKAGASSPQPLLEGVLSFDFSYDGEKNLLRLGIRLQSDKEKDYEISVFPKNLALARMAKFS